MPSDAPRLDEADCEFVALHKLAYFDQNETIAGQHLMAVAAWHLIHDAALRNGHAECTAYKRHYQKDRKSHFNASVARQSMTPEQVAAECDRIRPDGTMRLRNDAWLYAEEKPPLLSA